MVLRFREKDQEIGNESAPCYRWSGSILSIGRTQPSTQSQELKNQWTNWWSVKTEPNLLMDCCVWSLWFLIAPRPFQIGPPPPRLLDRLQRWFDDVERYAREAPSPLKKYGNLLQVVVVRFDGCWHILANLGQVLLSLRGGGTSMEVENDGGCFFKPLSDGKVIHIYMIIMAVPRIE